MAEATYEFIKTPTNLDRLTQEVATSEITVALSRISVLGDLLSVTFKTELSPEEESLLNLLVSAHTGEPLPPEPNSVVVTEIPPVALSNVETTSTEKTIKVTPTKLEGSSTILVSPNLCDKTTWYESSVPATEQLTTSDNLTYSSAHTHWIDTTHAKIPYEDRLSADYKPKIYVDSVLTTEGFTINYALGTVTFNSSQEGKVITASYCYGGAFSWTLAPTSGKILKIIGTMIKCTDDVSMAPGETIDFQLLLGGNLYGYPTTYKSFDDFLKCCSGIHRIEKFGNMQRDMIQVDFDYITSKDLRFDQATSINIKITGGQVPFLGTWACVVANVISVNL